MVKKTKTQMARDDDEINTVLNALPTMISIDPGLSGTGWAEWRRERLIRVGVIHAPASVRGTVDRSRYIADRLFEEMDGDAMTAGTLGFAYIEMPQHMTNIKGIAAQAGSIYALTFFVGYVSRCLEEAGTTIRLVTPMQWKGQLPKDVVQRRLEKRLGKARCAHLGIRTHAWDAVGLGQWAVDELQKGTT